MAKSRPPICPYCSQPARLCTGAEIYNRPAPDLAAKPFWKCDPCEAWVGCHPGTKRALGVPANAELRRARMLLHKERVDPLWTGADRHPAYANSDRDPKAVAVIRNTARKRVYEFVGFKLGLDRKQMHMALLSIEQCRLAWAALKGVTYSDVRAWAHQRKESLAKGFPLEDLPIDDSVVIVEIMNVSRVPETGGYGFERVRREGEMGWIRVGDPEGFTVRYYHDSNFLRWWPDNTDIKKLELTPRTNWKYQPSNGSEGDGFRYQWCDRCIFEREARETAGDGIPPSGGCKILNATMAFWIADDEYPKEWTLEGGKGPRCTAFVHDTGQDMPPPRCTDTKDMFNAA